MVSASNADIPDYRVPYAEDSVPKCGGTVQENYRSSMQKCDFRLESRVEPRVRP